MGYEITLEATGHQFEALEGESVLDAALRNGIMLAYGCRNGRCGSCMGKIVSGTIRYPGNIPYPEGLQATEAAIGMALFCQAIPTSNLTLAVKEFKGDEVFEVITTPCKVAKMVQLAPDVMQLLLKTPDANRLLFRAGQYINILLANGHKRAFSLANAPHDDKFLELHVRQVANGDFSEHVFNKLQEKDLLRIEGPLGSFYLREDSARPIIVMCGGTGFAPAKAILEHAFYIGCKRKIHLYWGARALSDLYQKALAQTWQDERPNFTFSPVLSAPLAQDHWQGRSGLVHHAVAEDFDDLSNYDVYMCGPPQMIQAAIETFSQQGLQEQHMFYDAFEYAVDPD